MDTSDRRSAPGNILFTQTCKRVHTYRPFDAEGANYSVVEPSRELNRRRKFEKREREREGKRGSMKEETIRGYMRCLFSSMIRFFFLSRFLISDVVCFFVRTFCSGTIVYKSFDNAGKGGKKKRKKKN